MEKFILNFIHTSFIGSIWIILLMVLRKCLSKKYSENFIYYMWLLIIVKLIIPFKIPIYLSMEIYNVFDSISLDKIKEQVLLQQRSVNVQGNISIIMIVVYIWFIGIILASSYYIYSYLKFIKNIKCFSYEVTDEELVNIYNGLTCKFKINKKISLKYYNGISSPFGVGILNPSVILPKDFYNPTELKIILTHELMHFKKNDLLYKSLLVVVKIVYWFNPLVYVMCNIINLDCELACDESLLKNSGIEERKLYAMTLINSIRVSNKFILKSDMVTSFNNSKNILKRRIVNMLNLKKKKRGIIVGTICAIIMTSSLISVNVFVEKAGKKLSGNSCEVITDTSIKKEKSKININSNDNSKVLYEYKTHCNMPEGSTFKNK
ncbi:M56 family metallopeptidase [Clostridium botulinum]|uniref:Peptidase n=1 Tax=Clostridium botulinum C/D str. DC5 TaxID=1443128 RepID=A0A0A0ICA2_CLOBO|nr:M56 family metallopeptidase [Clostridium botulinum]KGM97185.1 peptidase [Clostridium botulinum C/D str. DC5]KOC55333.1 peptidase [Clostridium botulinum]KOC56796.1 peptidase [Clostridium botulinum]MCD3235162.1 M56 family metallopeptidase [Clostridium botulinum D/C]MCD3241086.1 M56 family metallopeptidase [Clostridium botulinum D/C]